MFATEIDGKNTKLLLASINRLRVVRDKLVSFDGLLSPKRLRQFIPRLINRQSWLKISVSVLYSHGRGKVSLPENLYRKVLNYVLHYKGSNGVGQKIFLIQPNYNAKFSQHNSP